MHPMLLKKIADQHVRDTVLQQGLGHYEFFASGASQDPEQLVSSQLGSQGGSITAPQRLQTNIDTAFYVQD